MKNFISYILKFNSGSYFMRKKLVLKIQKELSKSGYNLESLIVTDKDDVQRKVDLYKVFIKP